MDSEIEKLILRWALWALFFALALGGKPWLVPRGGIALTAEPSCASGFFGAQ